MSRPIVISIRVPVETRKTASGVVIATCQFLSVSELGSSLDEALAALADALTNYFAACFDMGRFDQLFRSNGYSAQGDAFHPNEGRFVDVRLPLAAPHKMLSATEIAGGIRSTLDRCAA